MNEEIKDELLQSLAAGLDSTPMAPADAQANLEALGYDVAAEYTAFQDRLAKMLRKYMWEEEADKRHAHFASEHARGRSWTNKTDSEIALAFVELQKADFAMAARNLEEMTRDEMIAILEDMDVLDETETGDS